MRLSAAVIVFFLASPVSAWADEASANSALVTGDASANKTPLDVDATASATQVADGIGFPEGTVLVQDTLYFVDYQASTVNRLTPSGQAVVARLPGCGANGLVATPDALLVACYDSGTVQQISRDGVKQRTFERGSKGEPFYRPNDLVADARGGVYFTASGDDSWLGKVFYLAPQGGAPVAVADNIRNANGIALSPDGGILYVGESTTDSILRFDVHRDGTVEGRALFADLDGLAPGGQAYRHTPDGIRSDGSGHLFVALYNGGGMWVLDDQGQLMTRVALPGEHHSNLALSRDQKTIYATALSGAAGQIFKLPNPLLGRAP